jgi:hypothetical protein
MSEGLSVIENSGLTEDATVWPFMGSDDYGMPKVGPRSPIKCRWEWGVSRMQNPFVNDRQVMATVYVDRTVSVDAIVWRGNAKEANISEPKDLYQVVEYHEVPDVKGRHIRRWLLLAKYHNRLPAAS